MFGCTWHGGASSSPGPKGRTGGHEGHAALWGAFPLRTFRDSGICSHLSQAKNLSDKVRAATGWQQKLSDAAPARILTLPDGLPSITGSKLNHFVVWRKFLRFSSQARALAWGGDGTKIRDGGAQTAGHPRGHSGGLGLIGGRALLLLLRHHATTEH